MVDNVAILLSSATSLLLVSLWLGELVNAIYMIKSTIKIQGEWQTSWLRGDGMFLLLSFGDIVSLVNSKSNELNKIYQNLYLIE